MLEFLKRNNKEILIILGTILVYYILLFKTNIISGIVSSNNAFIKVISPGFFTALIFAITKQRLFYTLIAGITVSVLAIILMHSSFFLIALPGFISALFSAVIWKKLKKSLIIGILASILWLISFLVIFVNSYRVY